MLGDLGPERRKEFHLGSNNDLFDADENAKAAYAISNNGKSFGPWSTYTDGSYEKYLDEARKAARKVSEGRGKSGGSGRSDGGGGHRTGRGDDFAVDTDYLTAYTKKAERIAEELKKVGTRTVRAVVSVGERGFGKIGKETDFADALEDFSETLEKQVKATGVNAQKLGVATAKAAKEYREAEDGATQDIRSVLG